MSQFPAVIHLSNLNGSNGFIIGGEFPPYGTGSSVSYAGDVNGDGFADLIVGADGANPNGNYSGSAYVLFGSAQGFGSAVELSGLNGDNGFRLDGAAKYNSAGASVSVGDINGDGFDDIVVNSLAFDKYTPYGPPHPVAAYVIFGKASGFDASLNLGSLDGINGFAIEDTTATAPSITSVATADINGDGFSDVIIGESGGGPYANNAGQVAVVFGKASGFDTSINVAALDGTNGFLIRGFAPYYNVGVSVSSAGDINGDGFDDLIIGAPGGASNGAKSGTVYVVYGKAAGFDAVLDLATSDGSKFFKIDGVATNDMAGISVHSAGDMNGDGIADMIIGADGASGGTAAGAAYVIFGHTGQFGQEINLSDLNGTNGFVIDGVSANDLAGISVASAGDVNGDGYDDIIIGAKGSSTEPGAAYVVFGKAGGFPTTMDLSQLDGTNGFKIEGIANGDKVGFSVSSAGDLNGDGFSDIIIGAPGADSNGPNSGAAYVVYGRMPDAAVNRVGTDASQTLAGGNFDDTLSGLGGNDSLHGNGGNDLLIGGTGDDILNGGTGSDTASYATATGALTIDLSNAAAQNVGGGLGMDTFISIENLIGSQFNDTLTGNASDNTFTGGAGNDILNGGGGSDTASYSDATGGVTVSLVAAPQAVGGGEGTDTLISIENLIGSNFDDTLTGDTGNNVLEGGVGNDALYGGAGRDTASYADATGGVKVYLGSSAVQIVGGGQGNDTLHAIENITGSAFADVLVGSAGNNTLIGNAGDDSLLLTAGGVDVALGGDGDDTFYFGSSLTAADQIDGGAGYDVVTLYGDYSAGVVFWAQTMVNVEEIHLAPGSSYALTTLDANVAAGQTLKVGGAALGAGDKLTFNGSHETDGNFIILGGAGNDVLTGGAGNDTITGGLGADHLTGGLGADTFVYTGVAQSAGANYDTITGFDFGNADRFDLPFTVSAINTAIAGGALSTASFDIDLATAVDSAHLGKHDAVLFTPNSGDLAGKTFLVVDGNNLAGYQAGKDFVFQLDQVHHPVNIDVTDFI